MSRRVLNAGEEALVRLAWVTSGKQGEPKGVERKELVRKLRRLQQQGTAPVNGRRATESAQGKSLRFVEALFANAGRDLSHLAKVDVGQRYQRMRKPWKGRAGRAAAKQARGKHQLTKQEQAVKLRRQGLSQAEIGRRIDRDVRMVRRYLTDR
jgi:DNA-binding NarL/FixJ family response regulator